MSGQPQAWVLDSWGVVAFIEDEQPAATEMEAIISQAREDGRSLLITSVNLGEVWYSLARAYSAEQADTAITRVLSAGIEIVPADWELARQAARFKTRGNIAYGDCFATALGQLRRSPVITGDLEFKQVEDQVNVRWLAS